ncbi:MAG: hypothetical protein ACKOGH_05670 [Alphaproteobacteria bacterium]
MRTVRRSRARHGGVGRGDVDGKRLRGQRRGGLVARRDEPSARLAHGEAIAGRKFRLHGEAQAAARVGAQVALEQPRRLLERLQPQDAGVALELALDEGRHQREPDDGDRRHPRRDRAQQALRARVQALVSRIT